MINRYKNKTQQEIEEIFLSDTIAILYDYDGYRTVEGLKGLIDEARDRLKKLSRHEVTLKDLGIHD